MLVIASWAVLGGIRFEDLKPPTLPLENAATARGQAPWATNEKYMVEGRKTTRRSALKALDQPWSAFCAEAGRKKLLSSLSYYYEQSAGQERGYPRSWGEEAGRYIKQAWASSDDTPIERLTQESYCRGYFRLDDFRPFVRARIATVVSGERVTGDPCKFASNNQ